MDLPPFSCFAGSACNGFFKGSPLQNLKSVLKKAHMLGGHAEVTQQA